MIQGAEARQLAQGFGGLRFVPELEALFAKEYFERRFDLVRIGLIIAGGLYVAYTLLRLLAPWDLLTAQTTILRVVAVSSMLLGALFLQRFSQSQVVRYQVVNYLIFTVCLTSIELLSLIDGRLFHYEGMIFISFHVFLFSGLRFWHALQLGVTLILVYLGGMLLSPLDVPTLGFQVFFVALTAALGAAAQFLIEHRERESWLRQRELEHLANTDIVTGMLNRAAFEKWARRTIAQARTTHDGLCLVLVDVDHFKRINDRFGHAAGDDALARIGQALRMINEDENDKCARWGGDELIALWRCCRSDVLAQRFEAFRDEVHALCISDASGTEMRGLTVSCGGVIISPDDDQRLEDYLRLADDQLYAAKRGGRDAWRLGALEHTG